MLSFRKKKSISCCTCEMHNSQLSLRCRLVRRCDATQHDAVVGADTKTPFPNIVTHNQIDNTPVLRQPTSHGDTACTFQTCTRHTKSHTRHTPSRRQARHRLNGASFFGERTQHTQRNAVAAAYNGQRRRRRCLQPRQQTCRAGARPVDM